MARGAKGRSAFIDAERALWSRYGIEPVDRRVTLRAGNAVRIQEVGDGPPVVFVHGATVAGSSWVVLADALKDDFRCILVDRPGCGLSDPVPGGPIKTAPAFKRYAEELVPQLLDGLGLDAAPIACTSMGGFFGFRTAIAHPDRVTKVVAYSWSMGTPMVTVPSSMRFGSLPAVKSMMARMPIPRRALRAMFSQVGLKRAIDSGAFDEHMLDWSVALLRHTDTMRSELANNTFVDIRGANPEFLFTDDELQDVRMPVLLLWGDEDPNGGAAEAEAFAARLPHAELEILHEAGHAPWLDDLETCATRTREFLLA